MFGVCLPNVPSECGTEIREVEGPVKVLLNYCGTALLKTNTAIFNQQVCRTLASNFFGHRFRTSSNSIKSCYNLVACETWGAFFSRHSESTPRRLVIRTFDSHGG